MEPSQANRDASAALLSHVSGGIEPAVTDTPLIGETKQLEKSIPPPKSLATPHRALRSLEPSPAPSGYSHVSASAVQSAEHGAHHSDEDLQSVRSPAAVSSNRWRARCDHFWLEYKGMVLMVLAQLFGATMSTTTRYLETLRDGVEPMSTFQVLFIRMSVTMVASLVYMWWAKVPHAPLGVKSVRYLLLARGFGGFFGVFGLYYSLIYLPLAEATVITFLAPLLAAWICSILIKTPFTRVHKIAGFISLCGVVLIAQPIHFFASSSSSSSSSSSEPSSSDTTTASAAARLSMRGADSSVTEHVTPAQHAAAVGIGLVGVCGAACAYTTITWIGKRAHPLISVNYFATWCTIVSTAVLLFYPGQTIRLPVDWREWLLITFLGASGFIMQFLLTAALSHDRNRGKGLNMVYTQMLFALTMDKLVWDTTPGALSIVGSSMILGSAIWVAVVKEREASAPPQQQHPPTDVDVEASGRRHPQQREEEMGLVAGMDADDGGNGLDGGDEEERGRTGRFAVGDEDDDYDDDDNNEDHEGGGKDAETGHGRDEDHDNTVVPNKSRAQ